MSDDATSVNLRPSARFTLVSGWMLAASIVGFVALRLTGWLSPDNLFFRAFIPGWWLIFTCCLLGTTLRKSRWRASRLIPATIGYAILSAALAYPLVTYFSL